MKNEQIEIRRLRGVLLKRRLETRRHLPTVWDPSNGDAMGPLSDAHRQIKRGWLRLTRSTAS
jgi:hypothetical protein